MQHDWDGSACESYEIPPSEHADEAHEDQVCSSHLRGSHLVSASKDKTVRLWNIDTRRLIRPPLNGHEGSALCVQFDDSPDQDVIISGSTDASFMVWRFSTGEILKRVEGAHQDTILSLCFDDDYLVTAGKDGGIKVWNRRGFERDGQIVPPYTELRNLSGVSYPVNVVRMQRNTLVAGLGTGTISVYDIHTGQLLRYFTGHKTGIASLQYTGKYIISGGTDRMIRIFDLEQPEKKAQIASLEQDGGLVRALQVETSGKDSKLKRIVSGDYHGNVKIWVTVTTTNKWTNTVTLSAPHIEADEPNRIFDIQLDERRIVCCTQSRSITVWDFQPSDGEQSAPQ